MPSASTTANNTATMATPHNSAVGPLVTNPLAGPEEGMPYFASADFARYLIRVSDAFATGVRKSAL
jgi:hypothetical protein